MTSYHHTGQSTQPMIIFFKDRDSRTSNIIFCLSFCHMIIPMLSYDGHHTEHKRPNQGGSGWLAFGELNNKTLSSFRRAHICKSLQQKTWSFTIEEKWTICDCQGTYTYTDTLAYVRGPSFCRRL